MLKIIFGISIGVVAAVALEALAVWYIIIRRNC